MHHNEVYFVRQISECTDMVRAADRFVQPARLRRAPFRFRCVPPLGLRRLGPKLAQKVLYMSRSIHSSVDQQNWHGGNVRRNR